VGGFCEGEDVGVPQGDSPKMGRGDAPKEGVYAALGVTAAEKEEAACAVEAENDGVTGIVAAEKGLRDEVEEKLGAKKLPNPEDVLGANRLTLLPLEVDADEKAELDMGAKLV